MSHLQQPIVEGTIPSANQRFQTHVDAMHSYKHPFTNPNPRYRVPKLPHEFTYRPRQSIQKGAFTTNAVLDGNTEYLAVFDEHIDEQFDILQ